MHLSQEEKQARLQSIAWLQEYRLNGVFPQNTTHSHRTPVFIDEAGRICAVGFLIEKSLGREAAEHIDMRFRYATISDMEHEILEKWSTISGITLEEAGWIQPAYGDRRPPIEESPENEAIEPIFIALNVTAAVGNGYILSRGRRNRILGGVGFATGAVGMLLAGSKDASYPQADYVFGGASILVGLLQLSLPVKDRAQNNASNQQDTNWHISVSPNIHQTYPTIQIRKRF